VLLLIGLLFALIGVAVLIAGGVAAMKVSRASGRGVVATGTVVDLVHRVFAGGAGVSCPVIDFTTAAGQSIRLESPFGTMPASHRIGQSIAIRYDPTDPQKAEVDSAGERWMVPGCTIAMGLAFLVLGAALTVVGILVLAAH
jgi:hypothetical protein